MALDVWLRRRMAEYNGVGIEPKDVAAAVGVHPATVGRWLDGTSTPERLQVLRLAILFKVTVATIMRQTDPQEFARLASIEEARRGVEPDALEEEVIGLLRAMPAEERTAWLMVLRKRHGAKARFAWRELTRNRHGSGGADRDAMRAASWRRIRVGNECTHVNAHEHAAGTSSIQDS